ncbi:glycoside hydrolase family 97 protein [Phnomibacter sp. MR]|uniref:glycoside hydrolase family 97 protein n=1 Tax=Phnomibacter sp. MR TaxID=3042318 RepID=UPI003A7FD6B5
MRRIVLLACCHLLLLLAQAQHAAVTVVSPNNNIQLTISLNADGAPFYTTTYHGQTFIQPSALGVELADGISFGKQLQWVKTEKRSHNSSWQPVWGEEKLIEDVYNACTITLQTISSPAKIMLIECKVFNDGVGFRYIWPNQPALNHFIIKKELSEFALTGNHKAWWIPGDYDTNEYAYFTSPLSEVDATRNTEFTEIGLRVPFSNTGVQTPLMMKSKEGLYINIHEAALVNYPAMQLELNKKDFSLQAHLVPDAVGNAAYLQAPAKTPWRTILVSNKATDLLASRTILNLNEPSVIADPSFIKPAKYIGLWWEMHVGKSTWEYTTSQGGLNAKNIGNAKPTGRHGATTERVKQYIDFASKNGFTGVLVEGWNIGWEDWAGQWKENVFDFISPYPDFDLKALQQYGASKGVKVIMHHETSGSVTNYERYMDTAYRLMKNYGYDAVKTGYVGKIIPRGEHHDGQWMVNHYNRVAQKTADYKIMLDAHEPVRPTGLHRTYPNWLACEATRGNEFNAWSVGNPPEHETILPFTRGMGGPIDYTPGIFKIKLNYWEKSKTNVVHTTLAKQLALYVTLYSPLQMAADLPEAYEPMMDAFQFIKDVAVDWDSSYYLEAEPGDYISIARKTKGKNEWFIGAITDERSRMATLSLNFLPKENRYKAIIYRDADNADWKTNPMAYAIETKMVKAGDVLSLRLAAGGGCAIQIVQL